MHPLRPLRCSRCARAAASFASLLFVVSLSPARVVASERSISDPALIVSPLQSTARALDAQALAQIPWLDDPSWSPDGRQVAYTSDANGTRNIWVVDVDSLKRRAIAPADQDQSSAQWSPDGTRLLFLSDHAGDEMYDIYVKDFASGHVTNLTSSPDSADQYPTWSSDGRHIAFATRDRNDARGSIAVISTDDLRVRVLARISDEDRTLAAPVWSPNGDWIYYHDLRWSGDDVTILRIRPDGTGPMELTPHRTPAHYLLTAVSPDGRSLLIRSNSKNGWQNVAILDAESRAIDWITDEHATFAAGGFSPDGQMIAFTRNETADTGVFLYDRVKRAVRPLEQGRGIRELFTDRFPHSRQGGSPFSPDGRTLVYMRETSTLPGEILIARVADGTETTLVANSVPAGAKDVLAEAVAVSFPSADGKFQLNATVWMPPNLSRDRSHPAIVDIHGGPPAQSRARFRPFMQTLVSNGYVVISPNYRGSTGYDREFFGANHMDMGGGDLSDINATADWIARSGYVDATRIVAYGASYGGYLTLMAISKTPQRWAAGVAIVPFVDFFSEYANEAPWLRAYDRQTMGTPEKNGALWRDRSPLYFADRIRAPLLMTAGANDPRCPPEQARQMERAIRDRGGVVELTIYGDQGHDVASTENAVDEATRVLRFLNRYVRDSRTTATSKQ
jgi:dipeptidyl aminopeptidase/acylaminoacyl peptidase